MAAAAGVWFKQPIVWRNVVSLAALHAAAIYYYVTVGLTVRVRWYHLFIPELFGRLSGLGILAGCHRLWAHRSYRARLPLRIVLMLWQTMALQNDIFDWCRDHRVHHKFSDTDADPYNVRRGFFFSHMGWLMVRKHPDVIRKGSTVDMSDVWADPVVRFQRRFYIPLVVLMWALVPTYLTHLWTGFPAAECFLGAVVFRYVCSLHYTWTVNSWAHMYGRRPFDRRLEARQCQLVSYLSWGEGYHNYHHAFPWDYSASEHGWQHQFNLATAFIDLCAWLGLAYDRRKPSATLVQKRARRTGHPHHQQQQPTDCHGLADQLVGLLVSQHLLLVTCSLRIYLNGSI